MTREGWIRLPGDRPRVEGDPPPAPVAAAPPADEGLENEGIGDVADTNRHRIDTAASVAREVEADRAARELLGLAESMTESPPPAAAINSLPPGIATANLPERVIVPFAMGVRDVDRGGVRLLGELLVHLKSLPGEEELVLVGVASPDGPAVANWELSTARATAVFRWLVEHGVSAGLVTYRGVGEWPSQAAELAPRRVEVRVFPARADATGPPTIPWRDEQ